MLFRSVFNKMYPEADIPVYQLSVDSNANADTHFKIGKEINYLREKGVLILGSGNPSIFTTIFVTSFSRLSSQFSMFL